MPKLYVVTHGKHNKGGNTADTYDGQLTEEGVAAVKAIASTAMVLSDRCEKFCGPMIRQQETSRLCAVPNTFSTAEASTTDDRLAKDEWVFAMENGDDRFINGFRHFLEERRQSRNDTIVFSSRIIPIAMRYLQGGGEGKFGSFRYFLAAYEDAMSSQDANLPILAQANITEWEI